MANCSKCGMEIKISKKFCGNCGSILSDNTNSTRLVLSTSRKTGFFRAVTCYVIFNEDVILLAHINKKRQNEELLNHRLKLKEEGVGFIKAAYSVMTYWHGYGTRYYTMPKQQILKEDPSNVEVSVSDIQKLFFKTARYRKQSGDGSNVSSPGRLTIKTANEKFDLGHSYFDSKKNIKKLLSELFCDRLKYKGRMLSFTMGTSTDMID